MHQQQHTHYSMQIQKNTKEDAETAAAT